MSQLPISIPDLKLNDGRTIPMLGYGVGTAWSRKDNADGVDRDTVEAIKTAIKVGYHHIDAAEHYNTEQDVGAAIKESKVPREKLFVTTKVHNGIGDIPTAIDTSLKKLGLDYVDLYLIHDPFFAASDTDLQSSWCTMEEIQQQGKAKSIGVSNFLGPQLRAVLATATSPPSINQIEFHLYLQHRSTDLLALHEKLGIPLSCYGALTPITKAKPGPADEMLAFLAKKYYVSKSEILLRWTLDQGVAAITTSAKEQRLSDYLRMLTFKLTPREVQDLADVGDRKHFRGFWKKHFDEDDRS